MAHVSTYEQRAILSDDTTLERCFTVYDQHDQPVAWIVADQPPEPNKVVYWHVLNRRLGTCYSGITLQDARDWATDNL